MALDDYLATLQREGPSTIVDCEVSKKAELSYSSYG